MRSDLGNTYYLRLRLIRLSLSVRISSETVSSCLPLALRLRNTLRPPTVAIRALNPSLLIRLVFDG
mgnify:CR=1 FL=1